VNDDAPLEIASVELVSRFQPPRRTGKRRPAIAFDGVQQEELYPSTGFGFHRLEPSSQHSAVVGHEQIPGAQVVTEAIHSTVDHTG
jgi:hypothetical protein